MSHFDALSAQYAPTGATTVSPTVKKGLGKAEFSKLHEVLGAHYDRSLGTSFATYAPNAEYVKVIITPQRGGTKEVPMTRAADGTWSVWYDSSIQPGDVYHFEIKGADGVVRTKSDPFARQAASYNTAGSVVVDPIAGAEGGDHVWTDGAWMEKRAEMQAHDKPMNIYECDLASWRKNLTTAERIDEPDLQLSKGEAERDHTYKNYKEVAHELGSYLKEHGYTHVELMGLLEHPNHDSWGYQALGYFSPSSRFGSPADFKAFVDILHKDYGVGIILDWIPNHFAIDEFGLEKYDGTDLFERGYDSQWGAYLFDLGNPFVQNFLLSSARSWLEEYHIDGIRMDAVSQMIWGQSLNSFYKEGRDFIQEFNSMVHKTNPGVVTIAEESQGYNGCTKAASETDLGFDYRWDMGKWNRFFKFLGNSYEERQEAFDDLTAPFGWQDQERLITPYSHDEVSSGKSPIIYKGAAATAGDMWQNQAHWRQIMAYQALTPGKKLTMMGTEFAQTKEWRHHSELSWEMLHDHESHRQALKFSTDLNKFVIETPAFHATDGQASAFEWVARSDRKNCVIAFHRTHGTHQYMVLQNFGKEGYQDYDVMFENPKTVEKLVKVAQALNSDSPEYGGSEGNCFQNKNVTIIRDENQLPVGIRVKLPPLATVVFREEFASSKEEAVQRERRDADLPLSVQQCFLGLEFESTGFPAGELEKPSSEDLDKMITSLEAFKSANKAEDKAAMQVAIATMPQILKNYFSYKTWQLHGKPDTLGASFEPQLMDNPGEIFRFQDREGNTLVDQLLGYYKFIKATADKHYLQNKLEANGFDQTQWILIDTMTFHDFNVAFEMDFRAAVKEEYQRIAKTPLVDQFSAVDNATLKTAVENTLKAQIAKLSPEDQKRFKLDVYTLTPKNVTGDQARTDAEKIAWVEAHLLDNYKYLYRAYQRLRA